MQVARAIEPMPHTVRGKLQQIWRAWQLEARLSKRDILQLYLNHAPMGATVEGVEMTSRSYLGKSALSQAEAALLVVLPQAPPAGARTATRTKPALRATRYCGVWHATRSGVQPMSLMRNPFMAMTPAISRQTSPAR